MSLPSCDIIAISQLAASSFCSTVSQYVLVSGGQKRGEADHLVPGSPELGTALQVWPQQGSGEAKGLLPLP